MPVLNLQFAGEARTRDGQTVQLPAPTVLSRRGPVVQVSFSVGQSIAQQLLQQGVTLPPPISGLGLIDTGATSTCIDDAAAQRLGLPAIDVVTIASASHSSTEQNVYPIQIEVVGLSITVNAPRAIGAQLVEQGLLVLIGRDVLQHCVLIYNGTSGGFTLSI